MSERFLVLNSDMTNGYFDRSSHRFGVTATTWSGRSVVDQRQPLIDRRRIARPHQACGFLAIPEHHEGGPQFDPKGPTKLASAAIFDLDVSNLRMGGNCIGNQRLRSPTEAAPW